jgi:hypothetical protein
MSHGAMLGRHVVRFAVHVAVRLAGAQQPAWHLKGTGMAAAPPVLSVRTCLDCMQAACCCSLLACSLGAPCDAGAADGGLWPSVCIHNFRVLAGTAAPAIGLVCLVGCVGAVYNSFAIVYVYDAVRVLLLIRARRCVSANWYFATTRVYLLS